eukprot:m.245206 g.245206  ORF g.245206 m.245206 type:complete len:66 (-) comp15849_c0_seq15:2703-2900(-)
MPSALILTEKKSTVITPASPICEVINLASFPVAKTPHAPQPPAPITITHSEGGFLSNPMSAGHVL